MAELLRVEGLRKEFGGLVAVNELGFEMHKGEIIGLIGPNGAGKTTAFNLICGAITPTAGKVFLNGEDVAGQSSAAIVKRGLSRTFQNVTLYGSETVRENLLRGALCRMDLTLWGQLTRPAACRAAMLKVDEEMDVLMERIGLEKYRDSVAGTLPYGHQKRLGLAIGLAGKPQLLLIDEPAAGLNAEESAQLGAFLRTLRSDFNVSLLMVEHHMALVMSLCDRVIVLVQGQKIAEGTPEMVSTDPVVILNYLGSEED